MTSERVLYWFLWVLFALFVGGALAGWFSPLTVSVLLDVR